MISKYDHLNRRCPRLGSGVDFKYCRTESGSGPLCWKILDCWWETFDVQHFLAANLPAAEFQKLTQAQPPSKINSLLDLIEQAQKRACDS